MHGTRVNYKVLMKWFMMKNWFPEVAINRNWL
jgi:hypothetical protein